jgi:hypothetical protein
MTQRAKISAVFWGTTGLPILAVLLVAGPIELFGSDPFRTVEQCTSCSQERF